MQRESTKEGMKGRESGKLSMVMLGTAHGVRSPSRHAQGRRSRRAVALTHFFHERPHAHPATNASVLISRRRAAVSHIPQLRQGGKAGFHRHGRARGLVRGFAGSHGCAQTLRRLSQAVVDGVGDAAVAFVGGALLSRGSSEGAQVGDASRGALGPGVLNFLLAAAQAGIPCNAPNDTHTHTRTHC
jgi:hypothetical protein